MGGARSTRGSDGNAIEDCGDHRADCCMFPSEWWLSHHGNLRLGRLVTVEKGVGCSTDDGRVPDRCTHGHPVGLGEWIRDTTTDDNDDEHHNNHDHNDDCSDHNDIVHHDNVDIIHDYVDFNHIALEGQRPVR